MGTHKDNNDWKIPNLISQLVYILSAICHFRATEGGYLSILSNTYRDQRACWVYLSNSRCLWKLNTMSARSLLTRSHKWPASNGRWCERDTGCEWHIWILKWLMSYSPSLPPIPFLFLLFHSLCLSSSVSIMKLMDSQQGNLNCNLKAFLNNFDSLKVAHYATCRVNK